MAVFSGKDGLGPSRVLQWRLFWLPLRDPLNPFRWVGKEQAMGLGNDLAKRKWFERKLAMAKAVDRHFAYSYNGERLWARLDTCAVCGTEDWANRLVYIGAFVDPKETHGWEGLRLCNHCFMDVSGSID